MTRSLLLGVCCLIMLTATIAVPQTQAQTDSGLRLITELTLPNSRDSKFPHVAASNGIVHVSANANQQDAFYWSKADSATTFGNPVDIGDAGGQPDWSTTSITVGRDGAVYYAWIDQEARSVYMRRRDTAGVWGPRRTVDSTSPFPGAVEIGVASDGGIFIVWRDPDKPAKYRRSTDGGVSWSSRTDIADEVAFASPLDIATGPNGQVAVTFTAGAGANLQVFVAIWSGASFSTQRVTVLGGDYADSSITYDPNGVLYASWRGVAESGGNSGVFYTQRQADGSWPRSRLVGGKITGTVNLDSDEQGNLHLSWIAQPSGGNQLYYAFKPANDTFRGPIASGNRGTLFNSHGAASVATAIYAHQTSEEFSGSRVYSRYTLWQATGVVFGADPVIEGGAARVGGKTSVSVTFANERNIIPATTQVRWRWNEAPTDAASDSNGWQPYSKTISVPVPAALLSANTCANSVLYTQLRSTATGTMEPQAKQDAIIVDGNVLGSVNAVNPFTIITDTDAETNAQLAAVKGASGVGHPNYTRIPLLYLTVNNENDCSGLSSVAIGKTSNALEVTYKTDADGFASFVPLPDLANLSSGTRPVVAQLADAAGNLRNFSFDIILDEDKPVLSASSPGTITAAANPNGDILQNLTFRNINVSDSLYPRGFWGVWIANSRTAVADPINSESLEWTALEAPGGNNFTLEWSLASGLPVSQVTPGTYYIYVRFLDGAGNPSDGYIQLQTTSTATSVDSYLPMIQR